MESSLSSGGVTLSTSGQALTLPSKESRRVARMSLSWNESLAAADSFILCRMVGKSVGSIGHSTSSCTILSGDVAVDLVFPALELLLRLGLRHDLAGDLPCFGVGENFSAGWRSVMSTLPRIDGSTLVIFPPFTANTSWSVGIMAGVRVRSSLLDFRLGLLDRALASLKMAPRLLARRNIFSDSLTWDSV